MPSVHGDISNISLTILVPGTSVGSWTLWLATKQLLTMCRLLQHCLADNNF